MDRDRLEELLFWMADGAPPLSDGRSIVEAICARLNGCGVPVDLFRLFLFTLHPLIGGRRLQWRAGQKVSIDNAPHALFLTDEYGRNPLPRVIETRQAIRRRICDPDCPDDFLVLGELRAEGFTDYFIQPVIYLDGEVHTMSWATRRPGGVSDDDIAALERVRPPLSRLVEIYLLRVNAASILSTYVGRNAGQAVLEGRIRRGDLERIRAAILFADLKGYTAMSNVLPAETVVGRLNAFFDALEAEISANCGEILKFMGDGMLAIFPVRSDDGARPAAVAALACVRSAAAALAGTEIGFRTALHFGELAFGNIGAGRRLDFTAIGPAVNFCARLLDAGGRVGVDHACSAAIADLAGEDLPMRAEVLLKGFDTPAPLFAVL